MKARLAFAVAINIDPDILIVDEALAVGDAAFQRKCFAKMEQIREAGATILFVSHSANAIVSLCTRAIWLSNGEKIIEGEPKLITGLYMKNSLKKKINKVGIEKELVELEKNSEPKKKEQIVKKEIEEFYDPSLKPKSTIYYEEKGARISDIKVTTRDGEKVNVLMHGNDYIYSYKITVYDKSIRSLEFGLMVKNKNGIPIGGAVYPELNTFISVNSKSMIYKMDFKCLLNAGEYFFNAGVRDVNGYVHRILDAYMIKVISNNKSITSDMKIFNTIKVEDIIL